MRFSPPCPPGSAGGGRLAKGQVSKTYKDHTAGNNNKRSTQQNNQSTTVVVLDYNTLQNTLQSAWQHEPPPLPSRRHPLRR